MVVCIDNDGYPVALARRKTYLALGGQQGEKRDLIRVIDESGEDYFNPKRLFRSIALLQAVKKTVLAAA